LPNVPSGSWRRAMSAKSASRGADDLLELLDR
jgi:hypothetical protein